MYTDDEKNWLKGSMTGLRAEFDLSKLRTAHEFFVRVIPEFTFTFEEFLIANLAVKSRSYGLNIKGKIEPVITPYCDMFNFIYDFNTAWGYQKDDQGREGYFLTAITDIPKGD